MSLPPLRSMRVSTGNMIVGTWASRPAPTTSPIGTPSPRRGHRVLDVAIEIEAPVAALAADPGRTRAAERRPKITHEEAVHPYRAGHQRAGHPASPFGVTGDHDRRQPEARGVGHRDGLLL